MGLLNIISQVTYDSEVKMGYIYFTEPYKSNITRTEELQENSCIMLDLGGDVPIVGIELEGESARRIERIAGELHIFKKEMTADGNPYYSFRLNDEEISQSIFHPDVKSFVFHFSDTNCEELIGIDIFDSKSYSEQYLTGHN